VVEVSPDFFVDLLSGSFIFDVTNTILVSIYGILVILFMILLARTGTITVLTGFFTTFIEGMARFVHDLTILIFSIATNPEGAATYAEEPPIDWEPITWGGYIISIGKLMYEGFKALIKGIVDPLLALVHGRIDELVRAWDAIKATLGKVADFLGIPTKPKDEPLADWMVSGIASLIPKEILDVGKQVDAMLKAERRKRHSRILMGAVVGAIGGNFAGIGAPVGAVVGGATVAAVEYAPAIMGRAQTAVRAVHRTLHYGTRGLYSAAKSVVGGAVSYAKGVLGI